MCKNHNNSILLNTLNLSARSLNALNSGDINTVEDVLRRGPVCLMKLDGVRESTINEIIINFEKLHLDMSEYKLYLTDKIEYKKKSYPHNLLNDLFEEKNIYNFDYKSKLESVIKTLPAEMQEIIDLVYRQGLTLKESAERINRTLTVAARRKKKALRLLRHQSRAKYILSDNAEDILYKTENEQTNSAVLAILVIRMGLNSNVERVLLDNNIETLKDIVLNINEIKHYPNIGEQGFNEIVNRVELFGFDLSNLKETNKNTA